MHMSNKVTKFLAVLTATFVVFCMFNPAIVQAKTKTVKKKVVAAKTTKKKTTYKMSVSQIPGADEKSFTNATTRCLTAGMIALHNQTVKTMDSDIAKRPGHDAAAQTYRDKIDIVWSAMQQPYCGYGSNGLAAVKHSYDKSVVRIRDAFLAAAK